MCRNQREVPVSPSIVIADVLRCFCLADGRTDFTDTLEVRKKPRIGNLPSGLLFIQSPVSTRAKIGVVPYGGMWTSLLILENSVVE